MLALDLATNEVLDYVGLDEEQARAVRIFGDHLQEVGEKSHALFNDHMNRSEHLNVDPRAFVEEFNKTWSVVNYVMPVFDFDIENDFGLDYTYMPEKIKTFTNPNTKFGVPRKWI